MFMPTEHILKKDWDNPNETTKVYFDKIPSGFLRVKEDAKINAFDHENSTQVDIQLFAGDVIWVNKFMCDGFYNQCSIEISGLRDQRKYFKIKFHVIEEDSDGGAWCKLAKGNSDFLDNIMNNTEKIDVPASVVDKFCDHMKSLSGADSTHIKIYPKEINSALVLIMSKDSDDISEHIISTITWNKEPISIEYDVNEETTNDNFKGGCQYDI